MSTLTTCLTFANNKAEEAVHHYLSIFDGKIVSKMPGPGDTVVAFTIELFGQTVIALNGPSDMTFAGGVSLFVTCDTQDEVDRYWEKLTANGGKEIQCGWCVDKFGVTWQIVPKGMMDLVGSKDPVKAARAFQAMVKMKKLDLATVRRAHDGT